MPYIYSTLSADNDYSTAAGVVTVYGRTGARQRGKIDTPRGVATQVTDDQMAALKGHPLFVAHEANGFLFVERQELTQTKADKAIADRLQASDGSAQETEDTLKRKPGRPAKVASE